MKKSVSGMIFLLVVSCLFGCATHEIDEGAAASEMVEQQLRQIETSPPLIQKYPF